MFSTYHRNGQHHSQHDNLPDAIRTSVKLGAGSYTQRNSDGERMSFVKPACISVPFDTAMQRTAYVANARGL